MDGVNGGVASGVEESESGALEPVTAVESGTCSICTDTVSVGDDIVTASGRPEYVHAQCAINEGWSISGGGID